MSKSIYIPMFFLLFGLVATYWGLSTQIKNSALQQSGIVVKSLNIKGNTEVLRNGSHSILEIAPKFKTQEGEVVICRAKINHDMKATLTKNPIAEIRYLADKPEVCEVVGSEVKGYFAPLILGIIAILGSLVGLVKNYRK